MPGKPKVQIDEDGDGDIDVTVEIDTPEPDPTPDPHIVQGVRDVIARMEVVIPQGTNRITYSAAREALRALLP